MFTDRAPDSPAAPDKLGRACAALRAELGNPGYVWVSAEQMIELLALRGEQSEDEQFGEGVNVLDAHWPPFAESWNDLRTDQYMQDAGRYRKRRHAVCSISAQGELGAIEFQPHYQALQYNTLNGGVERWFAPMLPEVTNGVIFRRVLSWFAQLVHPLAPDVLDWKAEIHQFRIEAKSAEPGQPTPEGVHRDGVDFVMVMMIARHNISAGTTSMHHHSGLELGSFTLKTALETVLLDDHQVLHGVTAVTPVDADQTAYRDVLVLTLKRAQVHS